MLIIQIFLELQKLPRLMQQLTSAFGEVDHCLSCTMNIVYASFPNKPKIGTCVNGSIFRIVRSELKMAMDGREQHMPRSKDLQRFSGGDLRL